MVYDGIERRRWPRVQVELPIKYREIGVFNHLPSDSETRDISEGGIRFFSDKFLPKESKLVVSLNLQDIVGVKATIKVVWTSRDARTNMYQVGAQFDNIPSEARVQIANLVKRNSHYS